MFNLKFNDYTMNRYGYIGEFHEGLARVKTQDCFWGFINKRGKEVTPCCFINASDFSEGLVAVQNKQGLWGYINKEGKEVIPFKYRCASDFKEGRAAVSLEGDRWFYIDKCDNNICKDDYGITMAYDFSDGFGLVRTKYFKFAYIDHNGNVRKDCIKKATLFSNGFALCDDRILDKNFEEIEMLKDISSYSRGLISLSNNMVLFENGHNYGFGYINEDNKLVLKIPSVYSNARNFSDGFAIVKIGNDIIGFVNKEGNARLFSKKTWYQRISDFKDGLAPVEDYEGHWGFINKQGKEVIPCSFGRVDDFSEGLAGVLDLEGNLCYIDKKGNKRLEFLVYCSSLELADKTIFINANTEEELNAKKLQVLSMVKEEILANVAEYIDQLAYEVPVGKVKAHKKIEK